MRTQLPAHPSQTVALEVVGSASGAAMAALRGEMHELVDEIVNLRRQLGESALTPTEVGRLDRAFRTRCSDLGISYSKNVEAFRRSVKPRFLPTDAAKCLLWKDVRRADLDNALRHASNWMPTSLPAAATSREVDGEYTD